MEPKILILGGTSLISRSMLDTLKTSFDLYPHKIDLDSEDSVTNVIVYAIRNSCSTIYQGAWKSNNTYDYQQSSEHPKWEKFSTNLAFACVAQGLDFVAVGTCLDQESDIANSYVISKAKYRKNLETLIVDSKIAWLRPFFVFNFEEKRPRLVREFLENKNSSFVIQKPHASHDYIHSSDVGNAFATILDNHKKGALDVGSGFLTSNETLLLCAGKFTKNHFSKSENLVKEEGIRADIRFLRELGWEPSATQCHLAQ